MKINLFLGFFILSVSLFAQNDQTKLFFKKNELFEGQKDGKGLAILYDEKFNVKYMIFGETKDWVIDIKNRIEVTSRRVQPIINGVKVKYYPALPNYQNADKDAINDILSIVNSNTLQYLKPIYFIYYMNAHLKMNNYDYKYYNQSNTKRLRSQFDTYFPTIINSEPKFTDSKSLEIYLSILKNIDLSCLCYYSSNIIQPVANYISIKEKELAELIKVESENKVQKAIARAAEYDILLRHTFKYGIIGTDYVPLIEKSKRKVVESYYVNSEKVEISQYDKYSIGGYSQNKQGYTAVYQLINNTDKYYIIPIEITATCKFSKTIVDNSFWSSNDYKTQSDIKPILKKETYLIGPKEAIKDQEIVGENEPNDFTIMVGDVVVVTKTWVDELEIALKSNNLDIVNKYLNDVNASYWYAKILTNKQRIEEKMANEINIKYLPFIKGAIKPLNDLTFDPDFDSEVEIKLTNSSDKALKVNYTTPFGVYDAEIDSKSSFTKIFKIKGHQKNALIVKIIKVSLLHE
ncbi:MAG: hypothetical protein RBT49_16210 [Bacteroidales bacterium]|jgi:hypothetical protein|nr:hypothetical protein [Bacteroidales bacterium]